MINLRNPFAIPRNILMTKLRKYLEDDIGFGDLSSGLIPIHNIGKARIFAKSSGIIAGIEEVKLILEDVGLKIIQKKKDGESIECNEDIFIIEGEIQTILMVERISLNFLMKLSSIASSTFDMVSDLRKNNLTTIIATTRKCTPGFAWFEKKAVFIGGGDTHRWNLSDMVMCKDTHLAFYKGDINHMVKDIKKQLSFTKKIEIEIENPADIVIAANSGADIVMLDNMTPEIIKTALEKIKKDKYKKLLFEASGNINHLNILDYAKSGVDVISLSSMIFQPHIHVDFSLRLII